MEYKIRTLEISDYSNLIEMFKEFATFQKMPDAMLNSTDLMEQESELINGFVIESESGELLGYATCFMPITHG